jgi:hypothetical protein
MGARVVPRLGTLMHSRAVPRGWHVFVITVADAGETKGPVRETKKNNALERPCPFAVNRFHVEREVLVSVRCFSPVCVSSPVLSTSPLRRDSVKLGG